MTDLRKAAEDLLEGVEAAIKAGDWKVDGACDPESAIVRLRQALAQPEQEPVAYEFVPNGELLYPHELERQPDADYVPLYTAPPKRQWIGLTEDEAFACQGRDYFETYKNIDAKLKEKNA